MQSIRITSVQRQDDGSQHESTVEITSNDMTLSPWPEAIAGAAVAAGFSLGSLHRCIQEWADEIGLSE